MQAKIFVIILNFNCGGEAVECVKSVLAGTIKSWEIVVIDNASEDDSVQSIKSAFPKVKIIQNEENLGYAGGNNIGIREALKNGADYILILNPDVIVKKDAVKQLVAVAKIAGAGIVGPKILTSGDKIWSAGGIIDKKRFTAGLIGLGETDRGQYRVNKNVDFVSGTAMLVKREVFEKVGLLDERYFLYYEDVDFCQRAKGAGFKIIFTPKAIVVHEESASVSKKPGLKEYYLARNHCLFLERWAPTWVKFRELIRLPKTIWQHLQKKEMAALTGMRDYFATKIGIFLACFWIMAAFGIYFLLWFFRFLEPWQKLGPVMSAKESLKHLGGILHLWP